VAKEYHETAIPEPVAVLGIRLRPFSIGHALLLRRFEAEGADVESLLFGVLVCARDYNGALDLLLSPRRLALECWKLGLRVRFSGTSLFEAINMFRQYVKNGSDHVEFYDDGKERRRIAAPPVAIVKVFLQRELGLSENDALNMPLGKGISEMLIARAMAGDCELIDEQERQDLAELMKPFTAEEEAALRGN
jgi:hypothetical protein